MHISSTRSFHVFAKFVVNAATECTRWTNIDISIAKILTVQVSTF